MCNELRVGVDLCTVMHVLILILCLNINEYNSYYYVHIFS